MFKKQKTNDEPVDGVLNVVAKTSQLCGICILSKSVVIQLAEHMSHVCRQWIHVRKWTAHIHNDIRHIYSRLCLVCQMRDQRFLLNTSSSACAVRHT